MANRRSSSSSSRLERRAACSSSRVAQVHACRVQEDAAHAVRLALWMGWVRRRQKRRISACQGWLFTCCRSKQPYKCHGGGNNLVCHTCQRQRAGGIMNLASWS